MPGVDWLTTSSRCRCATFKIATLNHSFFVPEGIFLNTTKDFQSTSAALAPGVNPRTVTVVRTWLVLGVIVLNAIVVAIAVHALLASREHTNERVRQTTENFAYVLKENIEDSARSIDLTLQHIAYALELDLAKNQRNQLGDDAIEELLASHNKQHPAVSAFRLSDARGDIRWGKGVDQKNIVNIADRAHFQQHQAAPAGRMFVTEPLYARIQASWAIVFSRSYRAPDGSFAGVISAPIPVDHFVRLLSRLNLGEGGTAAIRHNNLGLVARYPPVQVVGSAIGNKDVSPEFRAVFETGAASASYFTPKAGLDGVARTVAFHRMETLPMFVAIGMSAENYLQPWRDELRNVTLLLIAFFLVSSGAAWLIWRYWRRHWQDISALQTSEAKYRTLFDVLPVGVSLSDEKGQIIESNKAAEVILELPKAEHHQRSINSDQWKVIRDDGSPMPVGEFAGARALNEKELITAVVMGVERPSHEIRWLNVCATPVMQPGYGVIIVYSDITQHKQMQNELIRAKEATETTNIYAHHHLLQ